MASIRRRNGRHHVQIRKNGYPSVSKTFIHLKTAKKWASGVEADMERQRYCPIPETIMLGELLTRYETEILPSHQSHQVEGYRLKQLNQHFSSLKLTELTSQEIARYRDIRLKTISPASLKRELTESHLFTYTARGLSGAFLNLCRKVKIEDLHFHDLRHEATSRFFEKGLNPVEVATITGHKDTKMLMRYTHLRAEDLVGKLG